MRRECDKTVARDILDYFLRNPRAADDLEGVARWRLLSLEIDRSLEETGEALEWLVKHGFLIRVSATGLAPLFRLNVTERAKAESFLAESADRPALPHRNRQA